MTLRHAGDSETSTLADQQRVKASVAQFLLEPLRDRADAVIAGSPALHDIDSERLALLAGFVCKVKNNDLWELLPLTRKLIHAFECEIVLFGGFRRQLPEPGTPLLGRVGAFVAFLRAHITTVDDDHDAIRELAQHEYILATLTMERVGGEQRPSDPLDRDERGDAPRLRATMRVQNYSRDPIAIAAACTEPSVTLAELPPKGDVFLCYARGHGDDHVRVFRTDPAMALVLAGVDGHRSAADIAAAVGHGIDEATVGEVLRIAASEGLIRYAPGPAWDDGLAEIFVGHARARLLHTLVNCGVLDSLREPCDATSLARRLGLNGSWLESVLRFVSGGSGVVRRQPSGDYVLSLSERDLDRLSFELRKFVGAYGAGLDQAGPAPELVVDDALAAAFAAVGRVRRTKPRAASIPETILVEHDVRSGVLDLGCGSADLLVRLAARDPDFRAIGVDANPAMCAAAEASIREHGVEAQVSISCGDARTVVRAFEADVCDATTAVYAGSLFNALFASGGHEVVALLDLLRSRFPGRRLFVDDYYGQLNAGCEQCDKHPWARLQDLAQVTSGQGIPAPSRDAWEALYRKAGCWLERAYEGTVDGIPRFVHVVELSGAKA